MRRNQDLKAPSLELQRIGVSQKPLQFSGREIFLFVQFVKNRRFECTAVKLLTFGSIAFDIASKIMNCRADIYAADGFGQPWCRKISGAALGFSDLPDRPRQIPLGSFDAIDLIGHGLQERFEQFPLSLDAPLVDHARDEFFG